MYNIGDEVYYITFFKTLKKVKILDKRLIRWHDGYGVSYTYYQYIIEFKSKRKKIVKEEQIF